MLDLESAIRFHTEEAEKMKLHKKVNEIILGTEAYERELQEHTQTAEWLKILKKAKFEYDEAWRTITHPTPDVTYADRNRAQIILDTFRGSLGKMDERRTDDKR